MSGRFKISYMRSHCRPIMSIQDVEEGREISFCYDALDAVLIQWSEGSGPFSLVLQFHGPQWYRITGLSYDQAASLRDAAWSSDGGDREI